MEAQREAIHCLLAYQLFAPPTPPWAQVGVGGDLIHFSRTGPGHPWEKPTMTNPKMN
ncbi:MAG: hypothetical protein MJE68_26520 [Proteobacteria bacterium]|nr:hypothetical protein [Pseudomonadota bacterium]